MITKELYDQIQAHATSHYTDGGWDVIVECFNQQEMAELLDCVINGPEPTLEEALKRLEPVVSVWADRQADARNSAF